MSENIRAIREWLREQPEYQHLVGERGRIATPLKAAYYGAHPNAASESTSESTNLHKSNGPLLRSDPPKLVMGVTLPTREPVKESHKLPNHPAPLGSFQSSEPYPDFVGRHHLKKQVTELAPTSKIPNFIKTDDPDAPKKLAPAVLMTYNVVADKGDTIPSEVN